MDKIKNIELFFFIEPTKTIFFKSIREEYAEGWKNTLPNLSLIVIFYICLKTAIFDIKSEIYTKQFSWRNRLVTFNRFWRRTRHTFTTRKKPWGSVKIITF